MEYICGVELDINLFEAMELHDTKDKSFFVSDEEIENFDDIDDRFLDE